MSAPGRPIVAAETAVLRALHAQGLLAAAAALPAGLHVAAATLADAARRSEDLPRLCRRAKCRTFHLDSDGMDAACAIAHEERLGVSCSAALAIVWASRRAAVLLTTDDRLVSAASRHGVRARGLPWIAARVMAAGGRAEDAGRGAGTGAARRSRSSR